MSRKKGAGVPVRAAKGTKRKERGARVFLYAVQPFGGSAYTTARLSVVSTKNRNPKTAEEGIKEWFERLPMTQSTRTSDLHRRLQSAQGHTSKVVKDLNHRGKANVVLLPHNWKSFTSQMKEMLEGIVIGAQAAPEWEYHQRWLLPAATHIEGGFFNIKPVPVGERIVNTGHEGTDGAWAMIQAWLDANLPIEHLQPWVTREEYMRRRELRIAQYEAEL